MYSNTQTSNGLCFRTQWSAIHVESLRTMRRHLDDRQRLTYQKTQLLKSQIPSTICPRRHHSVILFLSFFLLLISLLGWFWSTYPTICFRQHVDVDSPRLWQHRILSLRPRPHHRQSHHLAFPTTEKEKRFTCFAFDLPACLRYRYLCITMLCIIKTWGRNTLQ